MPLSTLIALLQDAPPADSGGNTMVKIVCGVLALIIIGIIIMRRKGKKKSGEEDF